MNEPLARTLGVVAHLATLAVLPFLLHGLINRVKSLWSGRKGPPLFQLFFDVRRLVRKRPVYSTVTTPLFRVAPYVFLASALGSALLVPLLGAAPPVAFAFDFVWFAYAWGLGRVALMLAALDTGSAFEGMGAAREALFASLLEPALFLVVGALCVSGGVTSLHEALHLQATVGAPLVVWGASLAALFIVLQAECARVPVDDPQTHLELTMVHEVMVLDHSGPELAAIQLGTAVKFCTGAAVLATMLNPWAPGGGLPAAVGNVVGAVGVAVAVGCVESLMARFKLRAVPHYLAVALALGAVALLATAWRAGVGA